MHFLLVRFSSIGDVVLQTAMVNWLRSLFGPGLRLTFLTSQEMCSLLEGHEGLDEVIGYRRREKESWQSLMSRIHEVNRQHPIHLILDLHGTLRSFRLKCSLWKIPALTVDKRRWERFFLTRLKSIFLRRIFNRAFFGMETQVERLIQDWDGIFGGTQGTRAVREFRQGPHQELTSLPAPSLPSELLLEAPYVVLAPGASFSSKRWPIESFVELAAALLQKTNFQVVVLAGKEDHFCEAFAKISSPRLLNCQGKTSLNQSMGVIAGAKLCIGNDSGMNHIAEALGVPVLTIFGSTDPHFGFAPHGQHSRFIKKDLWCSPCSTTGKKPCFRERHFCMEMISSQEVVDLALNILETA